MLLCYRKEYWYLLIVCMCATTKGFVSIFGDQITSGRDDHVSLNFQYGSSSYDTSTFITLGGFTSNTNSMAVVNSGIVATGSAAIQSLRTVRYRPGHESYALFSAAFQQGGVAGTTQWIGLFNSSDGIAVGFNGTTFSILYRNSATGAVVDTIIPQASFNGDTLNGAGASGFTLIPTNLNIFRLSFGWLGAATMKFQILLTTGRWITFHTIQLPNTITNPAFGNPMLPMRMQAVNVLSLASVSIASGSWNAGSISDPYSRAGYRSFCVTSGSNTVGTLGETHLITIQNQSVFASKVNQIEVRITSIAGGSTDSSEQPLFLNVRLNASLTLPVYSSITNSVVQYTTSGVYVSGSGTLLFQTPALYNAVQALFEQKDYEIILLPGQTLSVAAQAVGSVLFSVSGVQASLSWEERF